MENANKEEAEKKEEKAKKRNKVKILWEGIKCPCLLKGFILLFEWIIYIGKKITNRRCLIFYTLFLALGTFLMALYTRGLAQSNNKLVGYMRQANEREVKLFVGQNKPLIDVTPIVVIPDIAEDGNKMCKIKFSFVNYSGFPAKDISFDAKYGDKEWISEWLKAKNDRERKEKQDKLKGVELNHEYISSPNIVIDYLEPGKTGERKLGWPEIDRSGQLDLEKDVVGKKEGYPVLVRVTWQNEGKHVFEKIKKYKLLCTTTGIGHSFTFIPEGIVSQTTN